MLQREKFHHIVTESIVISNDKYPVTIQLLWNRYDNRKLIAQEHIRKLFDIKSVEKKFLFDLRGYFSSN